MAKPDAPTNEQPKGDLFEEAPKPPKAVIRIVRIPLDEDYQEPEGYVLKDIHNSDSSESFYGVLVKIQTDPNARTKSKISKPVNLS